MLALVITSASGHWGLWSPRPDFGKNNWKECQTSADAIIGSGACNWFAMRGAYWFNAGSQIGCKEVSGTTCSPGLYPNDGCCKDRMQPTNTDPALLSFPSWQELSKRSPFPYNLYTTEDAWMKAAATFEAKGNHLYFRGDGPRSPISKYNPWNAPGFAPVMDACGVHGGYPWEFREYFACGYKIPGSKEPADCTKAGPINGYFMDREGPIWDTKMLQYSPGTKGTDVVHKFLTTGEGDQPLTKWVAGGTAEVSQGWWESNHGGGYQFRLCKVEDFSSDGAKNEECFQQTPLDYASEHSWVQHGGEGGNRTAFKAIRVTDANTQGVKPAGSVWTKVKLYEAFKQAYLHLHLRCSDGFGDMQIPTCLDSLCNVPILAFEPPVAHMFSGTNWFAPAIVKIWEAHPETQDAENFTALPEETQRTIRRKYNEANDYVIVDKVRVPKLPAGQYVLSWRWDAEHSAQVWTNCAVIEIVDANSASGSGSKSGSESGSESGSMSEIELDARLEESWSHHAPARAHGAGSVQPAAVAMLVVVAVAAVALVAAGMTGRTRARHAQQNPPSASFVPIVVESTAAI